MTNDTFHLGLDSYSNSSTVLKLAFLGRQCDARPHVARAVLTSTVAPLDLLPADADVFATYQRPTGVDLLADGPEYSLLIQAEGGDIHVSIAASSHEKATEVLRRLESSPSAGGDPEDVEIAIWRYKEGRGGERTRKMVRAHPWSDVARNYPAKVRHDLEVLVGRRGVADDEGRLILFHGEPGTGKTSAIRALIHEWAPWCETHLVTDPDRMFAESSYLMEVLQSREGRYAPTLDRPASEPKWKLMVAEDADAYLRSSARRDAGAALGRLLNTTDGLLGQSTRILVLLTTNEELTRLHPALIRPGRCLARTEFTRFPDHEANSWLGGGAKTSATGTTLAQLYEARRTGQRVSSPALALGTYL